jgi:hypothetical protein
MFQIDFQVTITCCAPHREREQGKLDLDRDHAGFAIVLLRVALSQANNRPCFSLIALHLHLRFPSCSTHRRVSPSPCTHYRIISHLASTSLSSGALDFAPREPFFHLSESLLQSKSALLGYDGGWSSKRSPRIASLSNLHDAGCRTTHWCSGTPVRSRIQRGPSKSRA